MGYFIKTRAEQGQEALFCGRANGNNGLIAATGTISSDPSGNTHALLLLPIQLTNKADPTVRNGARVPPATTGTDKNIQFKTSGTDTNLNCVAWIAGNDPANNNAPRMPQLVASCGSLSGVRVCWKLQVTFHDRKGNPHRDFDTGDPNDTNASPYLMTDPIVSPSSYTGDTPDQVTVPEFDPNSHDPLSGWHVITDGTPWEIFKDSDWIAAVSTGFFGGDAVLSLKIVDDNRTEIMPQQDYEFRIAGENPDDASCKDYICSKYGGPGIPARVPNNLNAWHGFWFASAIARKETEGEGGGAYYNQFLDKGTKARKKQKGESEADWNATKYDAGKGKEGCPNWNNDGTRPSRPTGTGGYGLFQHTYEQGESNYIMPRKWIWNWRDNIDGVQAKLTQKYNIGNKTYQVLRGKYATLGDLPNHLNFSGLESLVITFYNGGGGETKFIPGTKRLTCWWGVDVPVWQFLPNENDYVDEVNAQLGH